MDELKVGDRLRVARSASGLTQEQAAERLGLARTTLVAIERGDRQPRPEELVAFAKLYAVIRPNGNLGGAAWTSKRRSLRQGCGHDLGWA